MEKSFEEFILDLFKKQLNLDLNRYRTEETKSYDREGLIFLDWFNMPVLDRVAINGLSYKYIKKFKLNDVGVWFRCIEEVK